MLYVLVFLLALSVGLGYLAIAGDTSSLGTALGRLQVDVPSIRFNNDQRIALGVLAVLFLALAVLILTGVFASPI
jgi:hypothetical protein